MKNCNCLKCRAERIIDKNTKLKLYYKSLTIHEKAILQSQITMDKDFDDIMMLGTLNLIKEIGKRRT